MRTKNILLIVLSLLGIFDSVYTQIIHHKLIASQFTYKSFCAISEFINCDIVVASKYGKILGIPNSYYGILTYSLVFIFTLIFIIKKRPEENIFYSWVFGFSLFSSLFSIYLFAISIFVIKALCLMCVGIYIINFAMLFIVTHEIIKESISPFKIIYDQILFALQKYTLSSLIFIIIAISGISFLYYNNINEEKREWRKRYEDIISGTAIVHNINIENSSTAGNPDAKVTIVEFSDFQCPFCKEADETLDKILEKYRGNIKIVFKHFPLDTKCNLLLTREVHKNACSAAIASICADEQGKFWEYKKLLFHNQEALDYSNLIELAKKAGLENQKFTDCLMSPGERLQKIVSDIHQGYELGVRSTPTLFLNGKMVKGSVPEWLFSEMIERELKTNN
jgi:protein-disulfide isomerase/uncharacterized membrane protein